MQKYLLLKTLFFPPNVKKKKSGNGTGVFLSRVQHRRAFSQFKRKRWFLVRDLYQGGSCINTISASPSPLTSCTTPDGRRALRQTLLRCGVNSAAPLALHTSTSCTQTFHGVNTQRSTPNAKWAACAGTKPASTFHLEYQVQTTSPPPHPPKAPVMALPVPHVRNVCVTRGETGQML